MAELLLTSSEMARADSLAIARGIPGIALMRRAGERVADAAASMAGAGARITVLCGPGNNGGDGFIAARCLADRGFDVRVSELADPLTLSGDARVASQEWEGPRVPILSAPVSDCDLIIDALFGAGLTRPLEGLAAQAVRAANASGRAILAVDVPSGLDGTTGRAEGPVIRASQTITFFRRKPGHLLISGRLLCGPVTVADIGLPESVLDDIGASLFANAPDLWAAHMHWPDLDGHKYHRGHALAVSGGVESTGAARLGARGALRVGAGLVTLASPRAALAVNAAHLTAIMLKAADGAAEIATILSDRRFSAVLIGPGASNSAVTREAVLAVLDSGAATVLDADALTSFSDDSLSLFGAIAARPSRPAVLTPHDGEFRRLFKPSASEGEGDTKVALARSAARASGAHVVLKGADTVIAAPDGRAAINENAPPWLATAGSGDVLAGLITGLLAQGMPGFEAACAGVWLHGACGQFIGPGLIAEDIPEVLPAVLKDLFARTLHTGVAPRDQDRLRWNRSRDSSQT